LNTSDKGVSLVPSLPSQKGLGSKVQQALGTCRIYKSLSITKM